MLETHFFTRQNDVFRNIKNYVAPVFICIITLGRACAAKARKLGRCVSVIQHLTSPMFVRLTNDATYLTGNEVRSY